MKTNHIAEKLSLLALFAVSVAALIAALPVHFDGIDAIAERALRDLGADSAAIGAVSVSPLGIRVKNVEAYKRISDVKDYRVRIHRADIRGNPIGLGIAALFSREKIIPPGDAFRAAYEKPLAFAGDMSVRLTGLRSARSVSLRGVSVLFSDSGKTRFSADDVSANIVNGNGALSGGVSVKSAFVPSLARIENFDIKLRIDGSRLDLTGGTGTVFGGRLNADLSLDLANARIIDGRALVKGLDLEAYCLGTGFAPGVLGGTAGMDVQADPGSPASIDSVKASGTFTVVGLTAAEIALQRTPAVNQLSRELRMLAFHEVSGNFSLSGGRINFGEIVGAGGIMKFRSRGWVDFTGRLSQELEGELNPQFVAKLPRLVRNSLERTDNGGGKFKCRITGTFHRPRVEVDRSVYNRAFRNLFK